METEREDLQSAKFHLGEVVDAIVKCNQWEHFDVDDPRRYTFYCSWCDSEADTEGEIEHSQDCIMHAVKQLSDRVEWVLSASGEISAVLRTGVNE